MANRARTAREAARDADDRGEAHFAAAMRGKACGLDEAASLLTQLEKDRRLPQRSRERPLPPPDYKPLPDPTVRSR